MALGNNGGAAPNCRVEGSPRQTARPAKPPLPLSGSADRHDLVSTTSQAGALFHLMNPTQKTLLIDNILNAMGASTG